VRESTVHAGGPRPARTRKTTYGATKVIYDRARRASARRLSDDGQATEPTGVPSAPVRSPGASPPGRLRPAGGAPLAYTLVPERW